MLSIKKKAISPLIATVLLIAFTITVATLVQNFNNGFLGAQQVSTTEKGTSELNCAFAKIRINSISYNGTSATLKARITNEDPSTQDSALTNITFSVITQDGSSSAYNTASGGSDARLYPGETDFYSNSSVTGGCNITSVYVSSSCTNAKDTAASSSIDFSGC